MFERYKNFIRVTQEMRLISGTSWTVPQISWSQKLKFQKTETRFCRWKSTDNNDINIFLSLENPCNFYLRKKISENAFLTPIVNYCKNVKKKQILPFKTAVNWLFNDIWHYLIISCFDWKIDVFQQTVVRGLLYL